MLVFDVNNLKNIINSVGYYIGQNIKPVYDTAIASTSYNNPLEYGIKTEDVSVINYSPFVEIEYPLTDRSADEPTGMGDNAVWQYLRIWMRIYPALAGDRPSPDSSILLENLFHHYFGTGLLLPIYDFTKPLPYPQIDGFYMQEGRRVTPKTHFDANLAIQKHRFDYGIVLRYGVQAASG